MIDKEKLRPAFERWATDNGQWPRAVDRNSRGDYALAKTAADWATWCAAIESLGEPVAYCIDSDDWGREYSSEDYFPGGRRGGTPLYRLPEVKE